MIKLYLFIVLVLYINNLLAANGIVEIKTNDNNCAILVNDTLVAKGNYSFEPTNGIYIIKVKKDIFSWDGEIFTDTVAGDFNRNYNFNYRFEEKILVETIPGDAKVLSGGVLLGNTPLMVRKKMGMDFILNKKGYEKLVIGSDKLGSLPIELEPNSPFKPSERFTDSNWFYTLLGSAVVLGTVAAYYKIKADNSFDDYEKTKDPNLLSQTDDYDLYSGVAFGALQVNFGVLVYYFLSD